MKRQHSQRGAILVESALIVSAIFLMLFGTVYVAIIGFDQMSADGASFEAAHAVSVGASTAPNQVAGALFPSIPKAQISAVILPAPVASIPVDYGYNSNDATELQNSGVNRHGGVSLMQGTQVQGVATKTSANILGMPIGIVGHMVEPLWLENGLHFDAQNSNNFGGTTAVCATETAPPGGGTPPPGPCFQGNALTDGENVPPYFAGLNFMTVCSGELLPWSTGTIESGYQRYTSSCPQNDSSGNPQYKWIGLGVAEFLNQTNWCAASYASGCPNKPGVYGKVSSDATFALIACHQRVYAKLASFFANLNSQSSTPLDSLYQSEGGDVLPYNGNYADAGTGYSPFWYYIRANYQSNYKTNNDTNDFKYFAGLDTPLSQQAGGTGVSPTYSQPSQTQPGTNDGLVEQIYAWDAQTYDTGLDSLSATNPGSGCNNQ